MIDPGNMTDMFVGLHGDAFVEKLRALALIASANGQFICCGACGAKAEYIGMQRCGAPGGPICGDCLVRHLTYCALAQNIPNSHPCCRHCGEDVDIKHVYAVNLWDGTEVSA